MKTLLVVWMFIVMTACKNSTLTNFPPAENHSGKTKNLQKLYLFGPSIDSTTLTVVANCDCCTSHLALFGDSTFIFVSYCVDGDSYSKGNFSANGTVLLLQFDSINVTQAFGFVADTSYEVTKNSPRTSAIQISSYKSKPVLIYDEDGLAEYGIEDRNINRNMFMENLRSDSVWHYLNK